MNFNGIATLNKTYIIKFNKLTEDVLKVGDIELDIDTRYNRQHHAMDRGEVVCTTEDDNIKVGDTALCQYLVVEEKNRYHEDTTGFYQIANRDQIFAILNKDEIKMLDEYVLIDPIEVESGDFEEVDGILIPRQEKQGKETLGIVVSAGDKVTNVKVGDKVRLHKSAHYPLKIDGKQYYRVRSDVGLLFKYV